MPPCDFAYFFPFQRFPAKLRRKIRPRKCCNLHGLQPMRWERRDKQNSARQASHIPAPFYMFLSSDHGSLTFWTLLLGTDERIQLRSIAQSRRTPCSISRSARFGVPKIVTWNVAMLCRNATSNPPGWKLRLTLRHSTNRR